jgi:SAM-dependent methyltransferase
MSDPTKTTVTVPEDSEQLVDRVRERYGRIAERGGSCCGTGRAADSGRAVARAVGYSDGEVEGAPDGANLGLGCGAPVGELELREGETVLDLGSGAGFDVFIAARQVGPGGRVIGVDMTEEMIERARENATRAGLDHVEFRHGRLESMPVEDATVDAVTSNCVINLVPDKGAVFRETARVLRPGGRLVVSDIVLDGPLPDAVAQDLLAWVGCVAGAMQRDAYFGALREAGLSDVEIVRDVDYLASVECSVPDELEDLVRRTGVQPDQFRGVVRSVTYRAFKR